MRFKTRPVEIEAMQFTGGFSVDEMGVEWGDEFAKVARYNDHMNTLLIQTLEGVHIASIGDWIIKGTLGEFYPCKQKAFENKYELAT